MNNSKKIPTLFIVLLLIMSISASFNSCSKDADTDTYSCDTCTSTPDALPENDNSAKGVYKGVQVGSSGTLSIDIQNGSSTITGTMVLDGITASLTSNVSYFDGEPYVAPFTGTYDGDPVSLTFSVAVGGGMPRVISSDIPGHPDAVFTIYKETSTSLIEAFEGTYSKPGDNGTFNILLSRALGIWGGVAKENTPGASPENINGTIQNNILRDDNDHEIGTLTGDEINGQFQDGDNQTITVTGRRTL